MSWQSGRCYLPADGVGASFISTDAYPATVRVDDADVQWDEEERVRVVLDESIGFPHVERGLHQP